MRFAAKRVGFAMAGLLGVAAAGLVVLDRPIRFDSAWTEATRSAFERATGLTIALHGPVDVTLFPRPTFVAHEVAIGESGGPVEIKAPAVRGLLSWPALLMGRSQVDKLDIENASGVLDADTLLHVRESAGAAPDSAPGEVDPRLPATVAITAGLLQIRSSHPGLSGFLMDLHLLIDGVRGGAGSISGGGTWHGERATVTARFDSLPQFLRERPTSGTIKLRSPVVSASAAGSFERGWNGPFKGSVSLSSPALSSLLRMAGFPPGVMAGIAHFGFSGTAAPSQDGVAFEDAHLAVNDDTLEGTLGVQTAEGRLNLVGTLATDKLDISPFVATLPPVRASDGNWNTEPIPFSAIDLHDTDLRLSVGRLILNDAHADDVALSLLCRKGRMELSLGEARAYGGLVKGRLFTTGAEAGDSVKADVSWSQVDVAALAKQLPGLSGQVAGSTSGYLSMEGMGGSASAIVRTLGGKGNASWRQGQVQSMPVVDALLQDGPEPSPVPVSFDLATVDFTIAGGLLSIGKGAVSGADTHLTVRGETFLPGETYLLSSSPPAAEPGADTDATPPVMVRRIAGAWGGTMQRLGAAPDLGPRPSPAAAEGAYP